MKSLIQRCNIFSIVHLKFLLIKKLTFLRQLNAVNQQKRRFIRDGTNKKKIIFLFNKDKGILFIILKIFFAVKQQYF